MFVRTAVLATASLLAATIAADTVPAKAETSTTTSTGNSGTPWTTRKVLNISHAGGDLEAPHSTMFAMKTAVAGGSDVLEMDVRLSSDGVLMVHHDDTVDRTTQTTGLMSDYTAAQLQAMDNAYWFVPNCWRCQDLPASSYTMRGIRTGAVAPPAGFTANDFGIATLAEVRAAFPDRILNIELKSAPTAFAAADALAAFINANGQRDSYVVASFDDTLIAYFESLAPGVATSPSQNEMIDWFVTRGPMPRHQVLQVPPTFGAIDVVTQQFVDDAHANGLAVWVWFNGEDDDVAAVWNQLIDYGVDGLLSGHPSKVQAVLDARGVGYAAAPSVSGVNRSLRRSLALDVACPALHVDRCNSNLIVVAQDANGTWGSLGQRSWNAVRNSGGYIEIRLTTFGQRWRASLTSPGTAYVLAFPMNSDTAPSVTPISVAPRPLA